MIFDYLDSKIVQNEDNTEEIILLNSVRGKIQEELSSFRKQARIIFQENDLATSKVSEDFQDLFLKKFGEVE